MTETMTETRQQGNAAVKQLSTAREADWPAVLFFIHVQLLSLFGLWILFTEAKLATLLLSTLGVTTGAHRLWAHSTYKASAELRVFLMLLQTLVGQGSIYDWVQNHRLHHAYYMTDNDPYDHRRGFVYSHFLTRLRKLSEQQVALKNSIDMFYWVLYAVLFILLPLNAPLEYWDDTIMSSIFVIGFLRYPPDSNSVFLLNRTFWPHYHYIFPGDYKSGEYGTYGTGCSTAFIRIYAAMGVATNLVTLEPRTVQLAMAEAARTNKPISKCIEEQLVNQRVDEDHYLKPKHEPRYMKPIRRWEKRVGFVTPIHWLNTILITAYHIVAVVWLFLHFSDNCSFKWKTTLFTVVLGQFAGFGITGGVHRYWTHRSFKAKLPLRIILMIAFSVSGQVFLDTEIVMLLRPTNTYHSVRLR
ncbi:unnamed protein product [Leptidea sinapis]|nr:unnamed protein product [Leptidea sinapis]